MNPRLILWLGPLLVLVATACDKGRYTGDRHYVGNPERPRATSESTMGDNEANMPPGAEPTRPATN
ncbi:MAG TPA: hypothetical protein VHF07_08165 [Nitrospiraceae bacterium]|nr:hypothetical protein [Nitrospiraceae bacterium]